MSRSAHIKRAKQFRTRFLPKECTFENRWHYHTLVGGGSIAKEISLKASKHKLYFTANAARANRIRSAYPPKA